METEVGKELLPVESALPEQLRARVVRSDLAEIGRLAIIQANVNRYSQLSANELNRMKANIILGWDGAEKMYETLALAYLENQDFSSEFVESSTQISMRILEMDDIRRPTRIDRKTITRSILFNLHPDRTPSEAQAADNDIRLFKELSAAAGSNNILLEQPLYAVAISRGYSQPSNISDLEIDRYRGYLALRAGKGKFDNTNEVDEWFEKEKKHLKHFARLEVIQTMSGLQEVTLGLDNPGKYKSGIRELNQIMAGLRGKKAISGMEEKMIRSRFDSKLSKMIINIIDVHKKYKDVSIDAPTKKSWDKAEECQEINLDFSALAQLIKSFAYDY